MGLAVQILKLKAFARFQRKERVLVHAVRSAESGLIDADLGGGLIKQRIARDGHGKSGGYRAVIAYRRGDRAVFLFGFSKSERANIGDDEIKMWSGVASGYLKLYGDTLDAAIEAGELVEVDNG